MELKSWCGGLMMSLAGMNFPLAAPYALFNGVRLPRLPYWDILRYPFAYIKKAPTGYNLSAMNVLAYLEDGNITTGGAVNTLIWNCTDGKTWVKDGDEHTYSEYYWAEGMHIWSNVAIGTKYPGTKPVPDYGGASTDDREPIAYSYNGVILPALPEWDRERYPYACVSSGMGIYSLRLLQSVEYVKSTFWSIKVPVGSFACTVDKNVPADKWSEFTTTTTEGALIPVHAIGSVIWANFDVLDEDGSIYLVASDPIPVYE